MKNERGAVSTFVVLMVVPMMMMAGLAFDGGRILSAQREALNAAQNAALAGSQAINESTVRQGQVQVNPGLVQAASLNYLATAGYVGSTTVTDTTVTVTVTQQVDMQLLSVIGVGSKTVTATGTSRLVRGVDAADT